MQLSNQSLRVRNDFWKEWALTLCYQHCIVSLQRPATSSRALSGHPKALISLCFQSYKASSGLSPGLPASDYSDFANGTMSQLSLQRQSYQPKYTKERDGSSKTVTKAKEITGLQRPPPIFLVFFAELEITKCSSKAIKKMVLTFEFSVLSSLSSCNIF